MVKLYLNDVDQKKKNAIQYIDVNVWSLVKAYIISHLIVAGIVFGVAFLLGFFGALMMGI